MRAVACLALALALASCSQFERFDGGDDDDASSHDTSSRDDHAAVEIAAESDAMTADASADVVIVDASGSDASSDASDVAEAEADVISTISDADRTDAPTYIRQCETSCPSGYHWVSRSYDPVLCGDSGGTFNFIVCMRD